MCACICMLYDFAIGQSSVQKLNMALSACAICAVCFAMHMHRCAIFQCAWTIRDVCCIIEYCLAESALSYRSGHEGTVLQSVQDDNAENDTAAGNPTPAGPGGAQAAASAGLAARANVCNDTHSKRVVVAKTPEKRARVDVEAVDVEAVDVEEAGAGPSKASKGHSSDAALDLDCVSPRHLIAALNKRFKQ